MAKQSGREIRMINFGKYQGRQITEIMKIDPAYVGWAIGIKAISTTHEITKVAIEAYNELRRLGHEDPLP